MSDINHALNEAMFEWALTVQSLLDRGWRLEEIDYGERRWDIGPRLLVVQGERQVWLSCPEDAGKLLV